MNSYFSYALQFQYNGACEAKGEGNLRYLENCLDDELEQYDKELKHVYQQVIKQHHNEKFKKIEQQWGQFKKDDCQYMSESTLGYVDQSIVRQACLINKTKARIAELKQLLEISTSPVIPQYDANIYIKEHTSGSDVCWKTD